MSINKIESVSGMNRSLYKYVKQSEQITSEPTNPPPSPGTLVSQKTPVLFATNKGLHLRTCHSDNHNFVMDRLYETRFCDLEKWVNF